MKTKTYQVKQEKLALKKKDKEWADTVKSKYGNKCALCNSTIRLNTHHIIPREIKLTRHLVENGIALCPRHHKWNLNSAHRNPLWFLMKLEDICPGNLVKLRDIAASL